MVDIHSEEYILGQNIRKYRLRLGWSQADLSNAVDIDRADISKYENGAKGIMSSTLLRKFAKALGVSMDALMDEEEPENTAVSIQEKYEKLSSRHQEMVKETIDAFLFQESHVAIEKAHELNKPVRNLPEPGRVIELLLKSISEQYHVPLDDRKAENSNGQQEAAESEENNG